MGNCPDLSLSARGWYGGMSPIVGRHLLVMLCRRSHSSEAPRVMGSLSRQSVEVDLHLEDIEPEGYEPGSRL